MDDVEKIIEENKDNPEALAEALRGVNKRAEETARLLEESENARKFQGQNFKKFRDMTTAEKELLTEKEKEIMLRQERLEEEQQQFILKQNEEKERAKKNVEENILTELVGVDQNMREKLLFHYNRIADVAETPEQITRKMQDAYAILARDIPTIDPLRKAIGHRGGGGSPDRTGGGDDKGFANTEEGKGLAGALGIPVEPPKSA